MYMVDIRYIKLLDEKVIRGNSAVRIYGFMYDSHYVVVNYRLIEYGSGYRMLHTGVLTVDGIAVYHNEDVDYRVDIGEIENKLVDYEYSFRNPICKLLPKVDFKFVIYEEKTKRGNIIVGLKDQHYYIHHYVVYDVSRDKHVSIDEIKNMLKKYAYVVYCVEV